jgi:hypothetical protein
MLLSASAWITSGVGCGAYISFTLAAPTPRITTCVRLNVGPADVGAWMCLGGCMHMQPCMHTLQLPLCLCAGMAPCSDPLRIHDSRQAALEQVPNEASQPSDWGSEKP